MSKRNMRKTMAGTVTSCAMDKTITVKIERRVKDPLYGKVLKKTKKIMVHDEKNECTVNDRVKVMETRPLSKNKNWRLVEVIQKAV